MGFFAGVSFDLQPWRTRYWVCLLACLGLLPLAQAQTIAPTTVNQVMDAMKEAIKDRSTRRSSKEVYEAYVSKVVDGDTLWVRPLAGGRVRKLRLDGMDAPESCQAGGAMARKALARRVLKQRVTVRVRTFDNYGRALARVEHQGSDMGAALVLDGHAWSYRWRNDPGPYLAEEWQARLARKGVFADDQAEEPRAFRRRNGPCPSTAAARSR